MASTPRPASDARHGWNAIHAMTAPPSSTMAMARTPRRVM
jgi:hypothetical protein